MGQKSSKLKFDVTTLPRQPEQNLYLTMAQDYIYRKHNTTRELFTVQQVRLSEIDNNLEYIPTAKSPKTITYNGTLNNESFSTIFYSQFKVFNELDFNNILIGGGCVSNILIGEKNIIDIDMFLYGLNKTEANNKLETIIKHILNYCTKTNTIYNIVRTDTMIRIFLLEQTKTQYEIQISTRLYQDKTEILYSFDLGSSCVGFDGSSLWFTILGKYSYVNKCNIIDTYKRNNIYEGRILKYYNKGFSIIFPFLNLTKLILEDKKLDEPLYKSSIFPLNIDWSSTNNKIVETSLIDREIIEKKELETNLEMIPNLVGICLESEFKDTFKIYIDVSQIPNMKQELIISLRKFTQKPSEQKLNILYKLYDKNQLIKMISDYENLDDELFLENWITQRAEFLINKIIELQKLAYDQVLTVNWITENNQILLNASLNPVIENPIDWYKKEIYFRRDVFDYYDFLRTIKKNYVIDRQLSVPIPIPISKTRSINKKSVLSYTPPRYASNGKLEFERFSI